MPTPTGSRSTSELDDGPRSPSEHPAPIDGYIEIHAHLLPGIDDGPAELDASLAMARAAAGAGTAALVATPHQRADFPGVVVEELERRGAALRAELASHGVELDVISGAEI